VRRETKNREEPRPQSSSSVRVLPVHGFGSVPVRHIFCLVSSSSVRFFQNEDSSSVLFLSLLCYSHDSSFVACPEIRAKC